MAQQLRKSTCRGPHFSSWTHVRILSDTLLATVGSYTQCGSHSHRHIHISKNRFWNFRENFIFLFRFIYFILCVFVFCLHVCICTIYMPGSHGVQKRVSDPLELELWMVMSTLWMVGIEHGFSARATHVFNHWASLQPQDTVFFEN